MADAFDTAVPCVPGCLRQTGPRLYPFRTPLVPMDGVAHPLSQHIGEARALRLIPQGTQALDDGCGNLVPPQPVRLWVVSGGPGNASVDAAGNMTSSGNLSFAVRFAMDCPTDLVLRPVSHQGSNEWSNYQDPVDEFYRGGGASWSTLPSPWPSQESLPPGIYRDNQGPSELILRARTELDLGWRGESGLFKGMGIATHLAPGPVVPVRCSAFVVEDCVAGQTPRWRIGCATAPTPPTSAAVLGFTEGGAAAPWEYSGDAGATWAPAAGPVPVDPADPPGRHRWRQTFTIPAGYGGFVMFRMRSTPPRFHGLMLYDDDAAADDFKPGSPLVQGGPGWSSGWVAVTAGTHTFEYRSGTIPTAESWAPNIDLLTTGAALVNDVVQVVECLDAAGGVASSYLLDENNAPYTLGPGMTITPGLCEGSCA